MKKQTNKLIQYSIGFLIAAVVLAIPSFYWFTYLYFKANPTIAIVGGLLITFFIGVCGNKIVAAVYNLLIFVSVFLQILIWLGFVESGIFG